MACAKTRMSNDRKLTKIEFQFFVKMKWNENVDRKIRIKFDGLVTFLKYSPIIQTIQIQIMKIFAIFGRLQWTHFDVLYSTKFNRISDLMFSYENYLHRIKQFSLNFRFY